MATNGINKTVQMLNQNVSSLDAIESGIRLVESDPEAGWVGYGGHPNLLGTVELDAGIMDGLTLNAGAVGALSGYLHPISVARNVMEKLPHVFLAGNGAAKLLKIAMQKPEIILLCVLVRTGMTGLIITVI